MLTLVIPELLTASITVAKAPKGHVFIRAHEDELVLRIANLLLQLGADLVDVDGVVAQKHPLLLVNADHHALFGDLFHGARLGDIHFNPGLQHRRRHHKDDEQHQHHVDQRRDVDIGERSLSSPIGCGKRHLAPPFGPGHLIGRRLRLLTLHRVQHLEREVIAARSKLADRSANQVISNDGGDGRRQVRRRS